MKNKLIFVLLSLLILVFLSGCDQLYLDDYSVSGVVRDQNGGVEGASVIFDDNEADKVITRVDGTWRKTGLKGEVEVRVFHEDYVFSTNTIMVSQLGDNKNNIEFIGQKKTTNKDYTVSGKVETEAGEGIEEARVSFGPDYSSVLTGADGSWEKAGLSGEVTVSVSKTGYSFDPAEIPVAAADTNVNFTAIKEDYTVSGKVETEAGEAVSSVEIAFDDNSTPVYTDVNGEWEKTGLTGEVVVTPQLNGWQFVPANRTVKEAANDVNFEAKKADVYESYSLSGMIMDDAGEGVPAVLIEIIRKTDNSLLATAMSDSDGNWTVSNIWGTVEIRPDPDSKAGVSSFLPEVQTKSAETENINFKTN